MTVNRPQRIGPSGLIPVAVNVTSLPEMPTLAAVVSNWIFVPEAEIEITASVDALLSDCEILTGSLDLLVLSDDDVDAVIFASDQLTVTAHSYATGDGPVRLSSTDSLPLGLVEGTDYWVAVVDANTIELHASLQDVYDDSDPVEFSDAGSGTHTISPGEDPRRVSWISIGYFVSGAGTIAVDTTKGRRIRFDHSPRADLYAIAGSMSGTISIDVLPVVTG